VYRDLILIALSLATWGMGEGMFYYFQPLYLQQLGADPVKIGGILGLVGLAMTLSYLPAGFLADRFGRRPLIFAAWIIGTASTVFMALANSLNLFVVGMVLYATTTFVVVPLNSYTTTARGSLSVGRTITFTSAAFNLGAILGPVLGGWIANRSGLQTNFRLAVGLFILSTLIILSIRSQPVTAPPSARKLDSLRDALHPRYLGYLALVLFITFGMYLPYPLAQNFLQNERGINLLQMGQLISARSLGIVILNLAIGALNARIGLLIAQFFMAVSSLLIWQGSTFPIYMLSYMLMGGLVTGRAMAIAQARTLAQAANMGIAYGLLETTMSVATILAPPLAGYLYTQNPEWIYLASLVLIGLGWVANLVFSPVRRRDLQTFEEKERAAWTQS
jgi:MFS family permease